MESIKDCGTCLVVDPLSRTVYVPLLERVLGTVGECNAEKKTFRIPKSIEGHDILNCPRRYVSWHNAKGDHGTDKLEHVDTDEEYYYFSWTIRKALTLASGAVTFSLHFESCNEEGEAVYHWGTRSCEDYEVQGCDNEAPGTYNAVYVDGDTLVFEDYIPVENETLVLNTKGD
jgi:hypothetical protein